jgi:hypothetical protein
LFLKISAGGKMQTFILLIAGFLLSGNAFAWNTPCTVDCSEHEAGYQWAEDNGIDDPDDCGGNSISFIDGCEEYAEENAADDEDDEDE